jgi:hypothetical protein
MYVCSYHVVERISTVECTCNPLPPQKKQKRVQQLCLSLYVQLYDVQHFKGLIYAQFYDPFTIFQSIYNFSIHLQFLNYQPGILEIRLQGFCAARGRRRSQPRNQQQSGVYIEIIHLEVE